MKLDVIFKNTTPLMNSDKYEDRFVAEYWQLAVRYKKLKKNDG